MQGVYKDETTSEWFYPDSGYILSETDEKGMILFANDLFCEVAGYKRKS
jgi:PAS domain-containing protein